MLLRYRLFCIIRRIDGDRDMIVKSTGLSNYERSTRYDYIGQSCI